MVSGHQDALDGLRAIAAFAVLVVHVGGRTGYAYTGTPASWVVSRGDIGVPIFFTLSGLLLYRPWARAVILGNKTPRAAPYLWRRALRILPVYWAVVLIALLTLNRTHVGSPWTWIQYVFLLQNYDPHPWWVGTGAPGLAQTWTLSVEMSFYLALPLFAAGLSWFASRAGPDPDQRARRLLTGIAALAASSYAFILVVFFPRPQFWLGDTLPRLTTWFAAGMAIAVITVWARAERGHDGPVRQFCRTVGYSSGACWLIAGLVFAIACTPLTGDESLGIPGVWSTEIRTALYTIVGAVVVASAAFQPPQETRVNKLFGNRAMRFLGKISYGIFLWQFLVTYAFFNITHLKDVFHRGTYSTIEVIGILIAVALLTIAVSIAGYYYIERPAQRLYRIVQQPPRDRPTRGVAPGDTVAVMTERLAPGAAMAQPDRGPTSGLP